jgi:DNA-binding LacI/PurR family transcriptional regulator
MANQTIKDVAAAAQVSIATVSRVINAPERVKPATVAAVRAAMADLGYRPNAIGQRLKAASSRTLGILVPSLRNPVFADSLAGIEDAAQAAGYTLLLTASNYDPAREDAAISTLLNNRVDGLVLTVADADGSPVVRTLEREGVPHVLLYNQPASPDTAGVSVDNAAAAHEMVGRLIALDHRHFAMVAGSFVASDRSRLRYLGFTQALAEAGLPAAPLVEVDFTDLQLTERLRSLLTGPQAPTAVFCSNDMLALATIQSCRALGLRVPEDLSVVGFDGIEVGRLVQPSLCTVVQPTHQMGQQAIAILLALIEGQARPRSVILPHTIRDGESMAPLPDAARSATLS